MPKPKPFHRMPNGQQKAHAGEAAKLVIKMTGGNTQRINAGFIETAARQTGVPEEAIRNRLKELRLI
jgi:hypothetical protein